MGRHVVVGSNGKWSFVASVLNAKPTGFAEGLEMINVRESFTDQIILPIHKFLPA